MSEMASRLAEWRRRNVSSDGPHPKCPYCGADQLGISARSVADDLEFSSGDDGIEDQEEVCEDCDRPYILKCEFTVEWGAARTDEEHEIEEAKRPDPNQLNIFEAQG